MNDNVFLQLSDEQIDNTSGAVAPLVPVAFWVAMTFIGSGTLGYTIGSDIARRGRR